jgi:hypothetical protein
VYLYTYSACREQTFLICRKNERQALRGEYARKLYFNYVGASLRTMYLKGIASKHHSTNFKKLSIEEMSDCTIHVCFLPAKRMSLTFTNFHNEAIISINEFTLRLFFCAKLRNNRTKPSTYILQKLLRNFCIMLNNKTLSEIVLSK